MITIEQELNDRIDFLRRYFGGLKESDLKDYFLVDLDRIQSIQDVEGKRGLLVIIERYVELRET